MASLRQLLDALTDEQWRFIFAAVEAGWTTPRISADMPEVAFRTVLHAVRMVRDDLRLDGRRRWRAPPVADSQVAAANG